MPRLHVCHKRNPNFIQGTHQRLEQNYQQIKAFPMMVLTPEDLCTESGSQIQSIVDRMLELMGQYSILAKDAFILSEAERLGIHTLATLDEDWERATGFEVFCPA